MTIVFLGDSVTHGAFELVADESAKQFHEIYDYESVYVSRIRERLQRDYAEKIEVINAGICGDNAAKAYARIDKDVFEYSPDIVVVCLGLNDIFRRKELYENSLADIFSALREKGVYTIFMTPNMLCEYVTEKVVPSCVKMAQMCCEKQKSGEADGYFDAAKKVCERFGIPVCDVYSKWREMAKSGVDTTLLLSNGINHPTREMHKLFADTLYPMIKKAVEKSGLT